MSDFDKEAERERLREKYGEDEDRESTEQMSELLLKGATMTNAHCDTCGDPIFRYDGQEFCPTCQQPVDRDDQSDDGADTGNIEVTAPSDDATVKFGDQSDGEETAEERAEAASDRQPRANEQGAAQPGTDRSESEQPRTDQPGTDRSESEQPRTDQPRSAPSVDPSPSSPADADHAEPAAPASTDGTASDHLTNARTLLAQTVEQYARQARDADSPRQAREYLEAAREAAATLEETRF